MYVKKMFYSIFPMLVLIILGPKTFSADSYSGYCVYPGGFFKINLSTQFKPADSYTVSVKSEHSAIEIYRDTTFGSTLVNPVLAGRYLLSDVNYVKFRTVSGPYLKLTLNIYDKSNNLAATVDSGKICNLSWWRDKHGSYVHPVPEEESSALTGGVLSLPTDDEHAKKSMVFCISCFALGSLMGVRTPKMLECLSEKGG